MKKNILILTNDLHLAELLSVICYMDKHQSKWARSGAVGYAILNRWKPDLIICGELDDCHAGSVAHTITRRCKWKPLLVAVHHTFGHPEPDWKYQLRCKEMGYDKAIKLPVNVDLVREWIREAQIRKVEEEWPGKLLPPSLQSSSGSSCGFTGTY